MEGLDLLDYRAAVGAAGDGVGPAEDPQLPAVDCEGRVDGDLTGVVRIAGLALALDDPVELRAYRESCEPLTGRAEATPEGVGQKVMH